MNASDKLNEAIKYLEDHLEDDIDYKQLARLAHCSDYHFRRMFSFLAGISVSEYVRKRLLTRFIFWTFSRQAVVGNHGFSDRASAMFWVIMGVADIAGGRAGNLIESRGMQYAFRLFLALLNVAIMMLAAPMAFLLFGLAGFSSLLILFNKNTI